MRHARGPACWASTALGEDVRSGASRSSSGRWKGAGWRPSTREALKPLRRGWYFGSEQFKEQMLERMEVSLARATPGDSTGRPPSKRANRIIAEEFGGSGLAGVRVGHSPAQRPRQAGHRLPRLRSRNDPADQSGIAARVQIGTAKGAKFALLIWLRSQWTRNGAKPARVASVKRMPEMLPRLGIAAIVVLLTPYILSAG